LSRSLTTAVWLLAGWLIVTVGVVPLTAQIDTRTEEEPPLPWEEVPTEEPGDAEEPSEDEAEEDLPAAAERLDRISFQVPFPPEKGGGTAVGTAGDLHYVREDYAVASGGVELRFRDFTFQGERVAIDLKMEQITAEGDVILDQGPKRLVGDTLFFDLNTESGTLANAKAYVDPDIFFEGREITRLSEDRYRVVDGMVTSCIDDTPDWNVRLSRGEVELGGYATATHARFRIKKVPIFYWPQIAYPANTDRKSGLLFPNVGYSERRGGYLGLAYFQTLGQSYDTTFYLDLYGEDYLGFGNEWRYQPSESTTGFFEGYVIRDPTAEAEGEDELRWKAFWTHKSTNLPLGLEGVIRYVDFSDFNFFRDFERDFTNQSVRRLQSSGFLTGSWGQQSFTLLLDQTETFVSQDVTTTQRYMPEAEYRLRPTQIGRLPVYVDLLSSVDYLNSARTDLFDNKWGRADVFPNITASLSTLPWLSVSVSGGGRVTYYSDSIDEETGKFGAGALTRTFGTASSAIVGPSFSRVFNGSVGRFAKFKHIIEPRWNYAFASDFEDQGLIPRFDEVDRITPFHAVSYRFINRLLAKPEEGHPLGEGAREIMSLEINQVFSLDEDRPIQRGRIENEEGEVETSTNGPIDFRYRFNPSKQASLEAKFRYNTLFGGLDNASLSGAIGVGQHGVGLTWFTRFNPEIEDTTGNQVRFFTGIQLWPNRLRLDAQVNYDFQLSLLQSQRYIFQYFSQCFGLRFEFQHWQNLTRQDSEFRFALTLKNIGTFLDLTGGTRTGFNPGF
jgi:LPS-assembly protein